MSLQVDADERIGIAGPNGAGISTLLRLLRGRQQPDEGRVSLGANIPIGEIDQACADFSGPGRFVDRFEQRAPSWSTADVRTLLAKFGLRADHMERTVDEPPGERTRAGLALPQVCGTNVSVLDEPTNYLDLAAIEQLEEALTGLPAVAQCGGQPAHREQDAALYQLVLIAGAVPAQQLDL